LIDKHANNWPYNIAYVFAWRGDGNNAFSWLEKSVTARDPSLSDVVAEPLLKAVRNDPRWLPFLRKIGRAPEQLSIIKFEVWPPRR
jgi:hypothetical protein